MLPERENAAPARRRRSLFPITTPKNWILMMTSLHQEPIQFNLTLIAATYPILTRHWPGFTDVLRRGRAKGTAPSDHPVQHFARVAS